MSYRRHTRLGKALLRPMLPTSNPIQCPTAEKLRELQIRAETGDVRAIERA